jgi:hypothetical protein
MVHQYRFAKSWRVICLFLLSVYAFLPSIAYTETAGAFGGRA